MTKRDKVLKHLHGLLNLGDCIHVLRDRKYKIHTTMKKRNGTEYAIYSM